MFKQTLSAPSNNSLHQTLEELSQKHVDGVEGLNKPSSRYSSLPSSSPLTGSVVTASTFKPDAAKLTKSTITPATSNTTVNLTTSKPIVTSTYSNTSANSLNNANYAKNATNTNTAGIFHQK